MRTRDLRQVGGDRVALLVALEWMPRRRVADRAQANVESRHTTLAGIRAVRSGDAERLGAVVGAEVRTSRGLILPVHPEVAVDEHRRADAPGVANGGDVSVRVAEPAFVNAHEIQVRDLGLHRGELREHLMRRVPVPVHLQVVVVAIGRRRAGQKQIVLQAVVGARIVWRRIQSLDLLRNTAETTRRNDRAGKFRASRAIDVAGHRIVELEIGSDPQHLAEVAVAHPSGRNRVRIETAVPLVVAFPRSKVEQLVVLDRTANGAANDRDARVELRWVEKLPGVQLVLVPEVEGRSLQGVGAGLGHERDGRAARHSLPGVKIVGTDVDRIDGLGGSHVPDMMRQPDIDAARPIQAGVVGIRVRPVHERAQRTARRVRLIVLERRGRSAGHQVDERLVVAVLVERKILDFLRSQLCMQVRLVGLQEPRFGRHRHRF